LWLEVKDDRASKPVEHPRLLHDLELEAMEELKLLIRMYEPYVLFSGGRDSLVALHMTARAAKAVGKVAVAVHVDTTIATPGNVDYVAHVCERLGVRLEVVRPAEDYFALVRRWGFPTATRRWCCYHLKIEPLKSFILKAPDPKMVIDGIRREESPRRQGFLKIGYHRHFKCLNYHPILDWSITHVREYISTHNLQENPLYSLGFCRASECWCPVFKRLEQFKALKLHYPELFRRLVELEASLTTRGSTLFRNGKKVYLRDL
jgi:3'-phosphoadenosine 5'-phosphosulfate sulfotransferase (PAPS reductase)/FAD synthetase